MNAAVKKAWNIIAWILVACIVLMAVLLAGVRLIGLTPYAVLSGSMEPEYHVGALIYVKKVRPEEIRVGDVITFVLNKDLTVVTHRVEKTDLAKHCFITKGDANEAPDGTPVLFENLVGKAVFTIPYLGYFSDWIARPPGLYAGAAAGAVLLIFILLPDVLDKYGREKGKTGSPKKKEQTLHESASE
ncbi:MAG: signal peptidase I [Clostridiales bacterium]|nr:signal peptidase I [Clostridiales bacterium]